MDKHIFKITFFGILISSLMTAFVPNVNAQRSERITNRNYNDQKVTRTKEKTDKKSNKNKIVNNRKKSNYKKHISKKSYKKPTHRNPKYHRYVHPRIGTHFSLLPKGFLKIRIGGITYYNYYDTYYRYDPYYRVYVVVDKPIIRTIQNSSKWDRIKFLDGSTIEGNYISSDDEFVLFEVGDVLLEIPLSEIKVLSFSER